MDGEQIEDADDDDDRFVSGETKRLDGLSDSPTDMNADEPVSLADKRRQRLTVVDPSEHARIVERVRSGERQVDVAKDYGISQSRISEIVKAWSPRTGATSLNPAARACSRANLTTAPPPEPGNLRHLKHGVRSERVMAPYRARAIEWAEARWPWLELERS